MVNTIDLLNDLFVISFLFILVVYGARGHNVELVAPGVIGTTEATKGGQSDMPGGGATKAADSASPADLATTPGSSRPSGSTGAGDKNAAIVAYPSGFSTAFWSVESAEDVESTTGSNESEERATGHYLLFVSVLL